MNINPSVTIGITCFNAEDTIERAILSAKAQTYSNFNIVIVDDASTDSSVNKIERLIAHDERITLIVLAKNCGVAEARNIILQNTQAEFLAFQDDDDESLPERLDLQYERLINYEQACNSPVLCYCGRYIKDNSTDLAPLPKIKSGIAYDGTALSGKAMLDNIFWNIEDRKYKWGKIGTGTMFTRTEFLKLLGGFDSDFRRFEDWDLAVRATFLNAHFISVNNPLIIQYKTHALDKGRKVALYYGLKLRLKYKTYLKKRGAYWASCLLVYYEYGFSLPKKVKIVLTRLCMLGACIMAPHVVLLSRVRTLMQKKLNS